MLVLLPALHIPEYAFREEFPLLLQYLPLSRLYSFLYIPDLIKLLLFLIYGKCYQHYQHYADKQAEVPVQIRQIHNSLHIENPGLNTLLQMDVQHVLTHTPTHLYLAAYMQF